MQDEELGSGIAPVAMEPAVGDGDDDGGDDQVDASTTQLQFVLQAALDRRKAAEAQEPHSAARGQYYSQYLNQFPPR